MKAKMEQFSATNPNLRVSVEMNGTVLYSNVAGESLLHEWGVGVGEKLPSCIEDFVQRVISRNTPGKMEVNVGKRVYLIVFHPPSKEECVNIYGFDISDQKELEGKLRESEEKYRNIVETANEGIWVVDVEGRTTYVNEKIVDMLGYSQEEMIGRFAWDFADEEDKAIAKLNMEKRRQGIDETHEFKLICKGGSPLWVLVSSKSFFDEDDKFIGSLSMLTDITEHKRVEEALCEGEELLRFALEISHTGAWDLDLVNHTAHRSLEHDRIFGYEQPLPQWTYEMFLDHVLPEDRATVDAKFRDATAARRDWSFECRIRRVDSIVRWIWAAGRHRVDATGNVCRMAGIIQDITERKKAEEALKEAYQGLEEKVKERTSELEEAYNSLKESEESLSEAQKMAHIGNWDWNIVTNGLYWSDEIYRIFSRTPQEFGATYDAFLSYVHPDDRDYVDNVVKEALNGKPYSIDHRIILANREERIVHEQGEVIFDEENIPILMRGTVQDITERKKSEEKIQNLANIVESSNDAIVTESLDGIITSWNRGAEQMYGYSAEEILGKTTSILAPSHLDGEIKKLTETVKQGEEIHQYETSRLKKDGKIIDVSITLSPVFDIHGKPTAISVIARDITESKTAEEKLRESEEKYRNIVETANEGILITDAEAIVTYANKKMTDMLGYTLEEGIGRPIWDFISEECKALAKLNLEKRRQGINESYELKLIHKDGSPLCALINAKSLFDKDGKFMGAMSMLTDITKRKEAESALKNIEITRKKEIHHRIKNNLQVISSLLDLQADKFGNPKVIEAFRESQNRIISMALIHEELYKGEKTDTLNFPEYLQELAENLFQTYSLRNKNIHLRMDLEENTFFDMDIAVPLGIIVNELVSNSLKHAFLGRYEGEIRIKLRREENEEHKNEGNKGTSFTLTVSDNGAGIPENLDLENPDTLGIQLITTLVDQLDGELELKRDNGTEFTIRFAVTEEK